MEQASLAQQCDWNYFMTLDCGAATFTLLQRFSHAVAVKQGNLGCSTFPVAMCQLYIKMTRNAWSDAEKPRHRIPYFSGLSQITLKLLYNGTQQSKKGLRTSALKMTKLFHGVAYGWWDVGEAAVQEGSLSDRRYQPHGLHRGTLEWAEIGVVVVHQIVRSGSRAQLHRRGGGSSGISSRRNLHFSRLFSLGWKYAFFCSNSFLARGKVCYICSTTMKRSAPPAVASIGAPGCSGVIYLVLARLPGYMGPPQGSPFTLFIGYEQYYSEHKYYWSIFSLQRPPSPYKSEGFFYCGISSLSYNLSHFERFSSGWNNPYLSGAQVIQRRLLCTKTPKHPLFKTWNWKRTQSYNVFFAQ